MDNDEARLLENSDDDCQITKETLSNTDEHDVINIVVNPDRGETTGATCSGACAASVVNSESPDSSDLDLDDVAPRRTSARRYHFRSSAQAREQTTDLDSSQTSSRQLSVAEGNGDEWSSQYDVPQSVDNCARSRLALRDRKWELNCYEAAIYLQEGQSNDKFMTHPKSQEALPAYLITHNWWFYSLNLIAAVTLLALAMFESPAVVPVNVGVHGSVELFCLMVIIVELCMRLKWLGKLQFLRHRRTMIKCVTLLVMVAEALVVLIRQKSHFRVTRAIRPLYLLDCYHMKNVRRFIRQVVQSLPAIFDILVLLLFFMLLFSILGFFLFKDIPNNQYFSSIQNSFVSLFVLLTAANFPDVMLPSYAHNKWSAIFFIAYISIELYLFMNLLLAVVYDSFLHLQKEKLKSLLLHKRAACEKAFRLLVSKQNPDGISLRSFEGLLKHCTPRKSRSDVYLVFKAMNHSKSGSLSQEEFYAIYDYVSLSWKKRKPDNHIWSSNFQYPLNRIFKVLHDIVQWKWFQFITYFIIFVNFVWIFADTVDISIERTNKDHWIAGIKHYIWLSSVFVLFYVLEAVMKILGLGPRKYFASGWNLFDFFVTLAAAFSVILEARHITYQFMLIFRPLRLLRLFKLKRRYRDVLGTIFILSSILICISIVISIVYYSFAIIGMEMFSEYSMKNCCNGTSVEQYYYYHNKTNPGGYYYYSTFDNILVSGVTLFELTVVNNWYIIMEGYAVVVSQWTRIYFMCFYLITMVIMTVVVSFILEAFMFRMQYRNAVKGRDLDDDAILKVDVALSAGEIAMCVNAQSFLTSNFITGQNLSEVNVFRGERVRSKDDFTVIMHRQLVKHWIEEYDLRRREELNLLASQRNPVQYHTS